MTARSTHASSGSVIIPAHNEERVIGRRLDALLHGLPEGVEVVVVANGCSDRTAQIARERPVTVIESVIGSKSHALNLGDAWAVVDPRVYLDADVELPGADLASLVEVLDGSDGAPLAAAPRYRFDTDGSSWPVRSYYRIWTRLPYATDRPLGSGVYALGRAGRARFARFPDAIADDLFVRSLFAQDERASVDGTEVVVRTARRASGLVARNVRVFVGNIELRERGLLGSAAPEPGRSSLFALVRSQPQLIVDLPAYVAITAVSKLIARLRMRRGDVTWGRDETSREAR